MAVFPELFLLPNWLFLMSLYICLRYLGDEEFLNYINKNAIAVHFFIYVAKK